MTRLLIILMILGFAAAAYAGDNLALTPLDGDPDYEREFDQSDSIPPEAKVNITHTMGDLTVAAWDKKEVRVHALIEVKGERAKEFGNQVLIEIKKGEDTFDITTRFPDGDWKDISCAVALDVHLPAAHPLKVMNSFGPVSVEGMREAITVLTASGDINVHDVKGELALTVSLGTATVKDCEGTVNVEGHSGNIEIENIAGDLFIQNALGHVDISNVDGSIESSSTNGNINARGLSYVNKRTGKGNRFDFNLSIGLIEITLPDPPSFQLMATIAFGSIESEFKLSNVIKGPNTEVCFTQFGNKQASLKLSTTNGNVRIKKEKSLKKI